ncbi:MAG: hydroxyisourate hydrolase [Pseudomonadota bacterium]
MGALTTHILDTANGHPAANVGIRLYRIGDAREALRETRSNADGRCDAPLLDGDDFRPGTYELEFDVAEYFLATNTMTAKPPFLNTVILRFTIADNSHYHVPLLVSPWSYSTYRGS